MRIDRIAVGDIVNAFLDRRPTVYAEVREVTNGVVHFPPLSPAAGWHNASAHQIVGHWRKSGRSSTGDADAAQRPRAPREQLSLPGIHG